MTSNQPAGQSRERGKLVRRWANEVISTAHVPMPPADFERLLDDLVDYLVDGLTTEPFTPHIATGCGTRLVTSGCTDPVVLMSTMDILSSGLLSLPELVGIPRVPQKVVRLLGGMASGYAAALREDTFAQQETLSSVLRRALQDVRLDLRATAAQFDHLVADTASGVAITEKNGSFVRVNGKLADLLGYTQTELTGLSLFDVAPGLHASPDGRTTQTRQKLLDKDGETTWASLTVSATDDHLVVTVEDRTELELLQGQLNHQALHDMVTRLPNRQFFTTRLERAQQVTVYHLDLDAFSHVTHGLGRQAGDRVLTDVGQRLQALVANEKAMVARLGADEFAILVENSSIEVPAMIIKINEALGEPDSHGVVTSACIGVVDSPGAMTADEILAAAELALARAKRTGRRQWSSFHPAQDIRDRETYRRNVSPSDPVTVKLANKALVRLHDRKVIGLDVALNVPGMPARLLRMAAEQAWQHPSLRIHIGLEPSAFAEVLPILAETRLAPDRLWLGMPASSVATDTLRPLTDAGVRIEIRDFSAEDITHLADLPIHAVRIAHRPARNFLVTQAMRNLTAMVHLTEAEVIVEGVPDGKQAQWWQGVGADCATGDF